MENWEGKLPDFEVVGEIGVGMICWHLEHVASVSVEGFGAGISLEVALASASPTVSVMTAIGTEGGEGDMDEAAGGWGGTVVDWRDATWCCILIDSTSYCFAASDFSRATSSCWMASACRSSAKLQIWFARLIFRRAWVKIKVVMNEWMAVHRRTRSKIQDGMRSE